MKRFFTKSDLFKFEYILFDLDDTIYLEKDYLFACYEAIETTLQLNGIGNYLKTNYIINGRKNLFDNCIKNFGLNRLIINDFLKILRTINLHIKLQTFSYFIPLVNELVKSNIKCFIVTNGNIVQQQNKIDNINWIDIRPHLTFVLENSFKPKPFIDSFIWLKENYCIDNTKTVYVGDSEIDAQYAINCRISFFDIQQSDLNL